MLLACMALRGLIFFDAGCITINDNGDGAEWEILAEGKWKSHRRNRRVWSRLNSATGH